MYTLKIVQDEDPLNINYDQTVGVHAGDRYISVYRNQDGLYERPVHYRSKS